MIERLERWDDALIAEVRAFLEKAPASTGACGEHDPRWLHVLRDGLGHRPYMLIARGAGDASASTSTPGAPGPPGAGGIVGYLPLAFVGTKLFGRFLVSLPYLNRAGVVAEDDEVAHALIDEAMRLADEIDAQYLELRHTAVYPHARLDQQRDEKVRMVLELPDTPEGVDAGLKSKVRSQVRKGDKNGLTCRWGGFDLLDAFYDIFAVNMRDLGTPVYGKRLFATILRELGEDAEICLTDFEGQPVACALLIHDRRIEDAPTTQVPSASSLRAFNHTNSNMWMYFQLQTRAVTVGSRRFDFGRSSEDSGTYKFKKQWGAEPHPTVWQYGVRRGDINAVRPDSPKYRRRIETWQKLPVWVTRLVGPSIVRGIP